MLGGVPAFCMAVSTYIGLGRAVPLDIEGALQHFAAGVLLCTVGTELLPEIVKAEGWAENVAAFIGFFFGVTVLIVLGMFAPHPDPEEEEGSDGSLQEGDIDNGGVLEKSPTPEQKLQLRQTKFVIVGRKFRQRQSLRSSYPKLGVKRSQSLSSLPTVTESDALISISDSTVPSYRAEEVITTDGLKQNDSNLSEASTKAFPLQFVLAVAIDSCLDGLLIGIASAAGPSAGPMMSASLSVEMGFLGLTLATTLSGQSFSKASLAALVGPSCLVVAAGLGGALAKTLSHSPVAMVGMLSFGSSALLFMVAEELLLDAHEDGEHVWWVDLQLYTGFFASIVAGKFVA